MIVDKNWRERIVCDPELHHGEPCVRATLIPVAILVTSLAEMQIEELLGHYPQLAREDIQATIFFAPEVAHSTFRS